VNEIMATNVFDAELAFDFDADETLYDATVIAKNLEVLLLFVKG